MSKRNEIVWHNHRIQLNDVEKYDQAGVLYQIPTHANLCLSDVHRALKTRKILCQLVRNAVNRIKLVSLPCGTQCEQKHTFVHLGVHILLQKK